MNTNNTTRVEAHIFRSIDGKMIESFEGFNSVEEMHAELGAGIAARRIVLQDYKINN